MASRTVETEIVYSEPVTIGRQELAVSGRIATITVDGWTSTFAEIGGTLYATCGYCDRGYSGTKAAHGNVRGGRCFQCDGSGVRQRVGSEADARKVATRRAKDRARAAAKKAAKEAEATAKRDDWREQQADLAAALESYAGDDLILIELASTARRRPLTDKQADLARRKLAEEAEREARHEASRYGGDVGQVVTVTGTVTLARSVSGAYGTSMLVIVEGAGTDAGVVVKTFSSAKTAFDLARGDQVSLTGTVKQHDEHEGVRQTVLRRPTITRA